MPTATTYIQLGDLLIEQGQQVSGVRWELEPVEGWDDPTDTTGSVEQRANDHGGWLTPSYDTPRIITLKGTLRGFTWAEQSVAIKSLFAALPRHELVDLIVATPGEAPLTAKVRQQGKPLMDRAGVVSPFSISLVAPDPRRYSIGTTTASTGLPVTSGGFVVDDSTTITNAFVTADSSTSGVITVTNAGNLATPWTATLQGPVPAGSSVTLRSGGLSSKVLRIPQEIAVGRTLVLDSDSRSALLDGSEPRVVTGTWFNLEPGVNEIAFAAPSYDSGALFSVAFRSAWL